MLEGKKERKNTFSAKEGKERWRRERERERERENERGKKERIHF